MEDKILGSKIHRKYMFLKMYRLLTMTHLLLIEISLLYLEHN